MPFGTPVKGYAVQGTPNPLQYMARELDGLSGLYYVRNRWYDPQQGRFVSEDPIGLAGGINQYAYAGGDPIQNTDPMGLCFQGDPNDWNAVVQYAARHMVGESFSFPACPDWGAMALFALQSQQQPMWRMGPGGVHPGGSGGGAGVPRPSVRRWAACVRDGTVENVEDYNQTVDAIFESVAGSAGGALQLAAGMMTKGELASRALQGSGLTTSTNFSVAGRWALGRSWQFSTPTMVQGISAGTRYVGKYALAGAVATNIAGTLAITAAWKSGIWIGSALVGVVNCS